MSKFAAEINIFAGFHRSCDAQEKVINCWRVDRRTKSGPVWDNLWENQVWGLHEVIKWLRRLRWLAAVWWFLCFHCTGSTSLGRLVSQSATHNISVIFCFCAVLSSHYQVFVWKSSVISGKHLLLSAYGAKKEPKAQSWSFLRDSCWCAATLQDFISFSYQSHFLDWYIPAHFLIFHLSVNSAFKHSAALKYHTFYFLFFQTR